MKSRRTSLALLAAVIACPIGLMSRTAEANGTIFNYIVCAEAGIMTNPASETGLWSSGYCNMTSSASYLAELDYPIPFNVNASLACYDGVHATVYANCSSPTTGTTGQGQAQLLGLYNNGAYFSATPVVGCTGNTPGDQAIFLPTVGVPYTQSGPGTSFLAVWGQSGASFHALNVQYACQ
jgi:hypothetical protein